MKKIISIFILFFILFTPIPSYSSIEKVNDKVVLDEVTFNLLVKDAKLKKLYEEQVSELELAIDKLNKNRSSLEKLSKENEELINKKIQLQSDIIKEYKTQKNKYEEIERALNKDIKKLKRRKTTSDILIGLLAGAGIAVSEKTNEKIAIGSVAALYFMLSNN